MNQDILDTMIGAGGATQDPQAAEAHYQAGMETEAAGDREGAIEEFRRTPVGKQVWEGAEDIMQRMGMGAKAILTKPKAAFKGIGRSIGRHTRIVGRLFKKQDDFIYELVMSAVGFDYICRT